jgi:hypothetical protein
MRTLPTVVLAHWRASDLHYDWLLAPPGDPEALLWTARVWRPPRDWSCAGAWGLEVAAPHRRRYLTYQGPLSRGRGSVRRVARGHFAPLLWGASRMELRLWLNGATGWVVLWRVAPDRWMAAWCGRSSGEARAGAKVPGVCCGGGGGLL